MNITPEMMVEDEQRWHARDVITELDYCGNYMRDRKDMTNLDIRFYAYLMRKAHDMLKEQEPRVMTREEVIATPEGTVVWMEEEAESGTYIQPIVSTGNGCLGNFYIGVGTYGVEMEKRRFWTSRPTPEQMRDTKWEEDSDAD